MQSNKNKRRIFQAQTDEGKRLKRQEPQIYPTGDILHEVLFGEEDE
jgi:hypothetical protein